MTRQQGQLGSYELLRLAGTGIDILADLGLGRELPQDYNPVWLALAGLNPLSPGEIAELIGSGELSDGEALAMEQAASRGQELAERLRPHLWRGTTPNKNAVLRAYQVAQIACLNGFGGPIGNGSLGTIRQQWYFSKLPDAMGFKFAAQLLEQELLRSADVVVVPDQTAARRVRRISQEAQVVYKTDWTKEARGMVAEALGRKPRVATWPKTGWGRAYAQSQSEILTELVRDGATYDSLWVQDASRSFEAQAPLLDDFHGVLLLEKEGLVSHFRPFCQRTGIKLLVGMAGNNAFSVVEHLLNENFRGHGGRYLPNIDNPLHLFVISDHDYYGFTPVQEGAVSQFEHYLPWAVQTWRVGIGPDQVRAAGRSVVQAGYEFDADYNRATREWADEHGVWVGDTCYGLEVEALTPAEYLPYLVDAVVAACGGDEALREALAEAAQPDWWTVHGDLSSSLQEKSELVGTIREVESLLWSHRSRFEGQIERWVRGQLGSENDDDAWWNQDEVREEVAQRVEDQAEDITPEALLDHAEGGYNNYAWSPVDDSAANEAVADLFEDRFANESDEFLGETHRANYRIYWHLRQIQRELEALS